MPDKDKPLEGLKDTGNWREFLFAYKEVRVKVLEELCKTVRKELPNLAGSLPPDNSSLRELQQAVDRVVGLENHAQDVANHMAGEMISDVGYDPEDETDKNEIKQIQKEFKLKLTLP